jgi:hypothetical protein
MLRVHDLGGVSLYVLVLILAGSGASALYNTLAVAAPLTLPLGLPTIIVFAVLLARNTR